MGTLEGAATILEKRTRCKEKEHRASYASVLAQLSGLSRAQMVKLLTVLTAHLKREEELPAEEPDPEMYALSVRL